MALILVLSVFNGFESLIEGLYNSFDPDIRITVKQGKTFNPATFDTTAIRKIEGVKRISQIVEENALLRYKEQQYIATIKGVSQDYETLSGIDTMLIEGTFKLQQGDANYAIVGYGVAYYLNLYLNDFRNPLTVYTPKRGKAGSFRIENAFNQANIFPSAFFSIQQDFDSKYIIVPIRFARKLLNYSNEVTALEIGLTPQANLLQIQQKIRAITGDKFNIENRYEQQALVYQVMKTERWATFLILTFILIIATFTMVGSLYMLIIDKKKDLAVLWSMGADQTLIRRIFRTEGLLISLGGAITGITLGLIIAWLQQRYGLIKLNAGDGAFIVNAYPVKIIWQDTLLTLATVVTIGSTAAWLPVNKLTSQHINLRHL